HAHPGRRTARRRLHRRGAAGPLPPAGEALARLLGHRSADGPGVRSPADRGGLLVYHEQRTPKPQENAPMTARAEGPRTPAHLDLPTELQDHPDYEVLRELGRGGTGVVYLARHRLIGRLEVLKVLHRGPDTAPD